MTYSNKAEATTLFRQDSGLAGFFNLARIILFLGWQNYYVKQDAASNTLNWILRLHWFVMSLKSRVIFATELMAESLIINAIYQFPYLQFRHCKIGGYSLGVLSVSSA
jgi:predicted membrane-bound dolichyl-phosphate-mannose-protein mannosyltransferase